jgi:DNA-binding NarL/FixJ family response regulator
MPEMQQVLRKQRGLEVIKPGITNGEGLLEAVLGDQPDIVLLDMTLPNLDASLALTALSSKKLPPYVVATAPQHRPHLRNLRRYRAVRGALPRGLALSPLLHHVLAGIAEGYTYFVPEPPPGKSKLADDESILLALLALGLGTHELSLELGWKRDKVYSKQCNMRNALGVRHNTEAVSIGHKQGLVAMLTDAGDREARKETA